MDTPRRANTRRETPQESKYSAVKCKAEDQRVDRQSGGKMK